MESQESSGGIADLAYQRAREALERALAEAQATRFQAIEDARSTRESELTALMETMRALRQSAESQISASFRAAELDTTRIHDQAKAEAESILERASNEASEIKIEAAGIRANAEERLREIERLEAEFDLVVSNLAKRIGITDKPSGGWWRRIGSKKK